MEITDGTEGQIVYSPGSYQDLTPAQLLVRLDALRAHCIDIGESILNQSTAEARLFSLLEGSTCTILMSFINKRPFTLLHARQHVNELIDQGTSVEKVHQLIGRLTAPMVVKAAELFPLMACKQLLEGFRDAHVDAGFSVDMHTGITFSGSAHGSIGTHSNASQVSAGAGAGAGVHAGDGSSTSRSGGLTLAVKLFFTPCIEWLDHLIKAAAPTELPSAENVIEMFLRGKLNDDEAQGYLALNGCSWQLWKQVALSRAERPSILEIVQDSMRKVMGAVVSTDEALKAFSFDADQAAAVKELVAEQCALRGYAQGIDPEIFIRLYQEIPTITDHLHWLARNADDLEYLSEFNLWAGFSDKATVVKMFTELAQRTGYDQAYPAKFAALLQHVQTAALPEIYQTRDFYKTFRSDLISQGQRSVDTFLHYVAHWLQPALGEQREMLWRLRPGAVPDNLVFGPTQLLRAMSEKDIAPFFQERLLATAYHVIPLRFLRSLYNYSSISADKAKGILQDQGYTAADADTLVSAMELQRKLFVASQGHGYTPAELQTLFADGAIDADNYRVRLKAYGFDDTTIDQGIEKVKAAFGHKLALQVVAKVRRDFLSGLLTETQARNRLSNQLFNNDLIDLTMNEWSVEKELAEAEETKKHADQVQKEKTKVIREGFLAGRWNIAQAAAMLAQAGVSGAVIAELSDLWTLELAAKSKPLPLSTLIADAKSGSLPAGQLAALMSSMNYSAEAIGEAIADVITAGNNADQKKKDALSKQLAAQAAKLTRTKKHQASIAFNYKSAVQKADLSVELANETDKVQKATQKANLAKLLAAGKEQVDAMPPV